MPYDNYVRLLRSCHYVRIGHVENNVRKFVAFARAQRELKEANGTY